MTTDTPIIRKVTIDPVGASWEVTLVARNGRSVSHGEYDTERSAVNAAARLAAQLGVPVER